MYKTSIETDEIKENVLAGIVGAFLFSLVGGILWFVLYQIGYIASASGLVGVICAVKGYTIFAKTKKESIKCLVLSSIIAIAVLALSWYFSVAYDFYLAFQELFIDGEIDFTVSFFETLRAVPYFLEDGEVFSAYMSDLGAGIFFAIIGVVSYFFSRRKNKKAVLAEAEKVKQHAEIAEAEAASEAEATETVEQSDSAEEGTPTDVAE